uniref:Uncharacterized protein n=1 Tax=Arundo donax TaxID=35708 RepID=A0A0A9HLZ7_ARUDO
MWSLSLVVVLVLFTFLFFHCSLKLWSKTLSMTK